MSFSFIYVMIHFLQRESGKKAKNEKMCQILGMVFKMCPVY